MSESTQVINNIIQLNTNFLYNILGEKPYPCPICSKQFRVRSDMNRHKKTHNRKRLLTKKLHPEDPLKIEGNDDMLHHSEESTETKMRLNDNQDVESLQYEQDPLDTRDDNTLYVMPVIIS